MRLPPPHKRKPLLLSNLFFFAFPLTCQSASERETMATPTSHITMQSPARFHASLPSYRTVSCRVGYGGGSKRFRKERVCGS